MCAARQHHAFDCPVVKGSSVTVWGIESDVDHNLHGPVETHSTVEKYLENLGGGPKRNLETWTDQLHKYIME